MYGLRTSPKLWQLHLGAVLRQQNLQQCKADRCLWTTAGLGVLVYVDDLLLVGETSKEGYFHIEACYNFVKNYRHSFFGEETTAT